MKLCMYTGLMLLLTACASRNAEQDKKVTKTTDTVYKIGLVDSMGRYGCFIDGDDPAPTRMRSWYVLELIADAEPVPASIKMDAAAINTYTCNVDKNPAQIVHDLLPGKVYRGTNEYMDSVPLNIWVCPTCETDSVKENYVLYDSYVFPYADINTTLVDTTLDYTLNGVKYKAISIFHTNSPAPDFTGRYMGADMGLLVFKISGRQMKLVMFDLFLGSFGAFRHPVVPKIYIVNNTPWFEYRFANGGPGEPYTSHSEIFTPRAGKMARVLEDDFMGLFNTGAGAWNTSTTFTTKGELQLTTTGHVNPHLLYTYYAWLMEAFPAEFVTVLKQHRDTNRCMPVKVERTLGLHEGVFVMQDIEVKLD